MKNKGYTLLEAMIVVFMLMMVLTIISIVYVSLIKATILANDYYQSLENVKLGAEKVWRILKNSWNFQVSGRSSINFKKKDCTPAWINFDISNLRLNYCEISTCTSVFDENLVKVKDFWVATDTPNTSQTYAYFQYAPKIIVLYYNLELKSKRGVTTTLEFQQAVAPLNSVYSQNLCP